MSKLVYRITCLLSAVVERVPIGTNLGVFIYSGCCSAGGCWRVAGR